MTLKLSSLHLGSLLFFSTFSVSCSDKGSADSGASDGPPGERIGSDLERDAGDDVTDEALAALTRANRAFALDLYHATTPETGNQLLAPHSLTMALAMTLGGAEGDTQSQLKAVMHLDGLADDAVHPAFNALDLRLDSAASASATSVVDGFAFELNTINQSWGQDGLELDSDYLDLLAQRYGAAMYLLDFEHEAPQAREDVNAWVSDETRGQIPELLPEGFFNDETKLALVNALYFSAPWDLPFVESSSTAGTFTGLDGSTSEVTMMTQTIEGGGYALGDGWTLVELPYVGRYFGMSLIVPDAGRFTEVESALDIDLLDEMDAARTTARVILMLPRFKVSATNDLAETLQALGATDAFDRNLADFTGMIPSAQDKAGDYIRVQDILQSATLEVDEQGTIAAAATVVEVGGEGEGEGEEEPEEVTITVDRPFLVLVRSYATDEILFLGRVLDPSGG